jgi:hypothetical protein
VTADEAIFAALEEAGSISPQQAAQLMDAENWRARLSEVRAAALRLAKEGRLEILRKGKAVAPEGVKGVIRLRLPRDDA